MIQRRTLVTALSGVIVGGMLLSGGMAIAGDSSSVSDKPAGRMQFSGQMMNHRDGMAKGGRVLSQQQLTDTLKALVGKGTITQEQSDKVLKRFQDAEKENTAFKKKLENMTLKEIRQYMQDNKGKLRQNPLSQLVAEGTITQQQADAIKASMRETAQKQRQQQIASSLKTLVDKGTITQEQSDKILKKIEDNQKEHQALYQKIKNMTPEERRQYMKDDKGKSKHQNLLSQLVAEGTITQTQADAIREVFPMNKEFKGRHSGFGGFKGGFGGGFKEGRN